jgi:hypothetical protein
MRDGAGVVIHIDSDRAARIACSVADKKVARKIGGKHAADRCTDLLLAPDSNKTRRRNRKSSRSQINHGVCSKGSSRVTRLLQLPQCPLQ